MQTKLRLETEHKSRTLTRGMLQELVEEIGLISKETYSERCLSFNSYNVRIGCLIVFSGTGEIRELKNNETFSIAPGAYVGITSRENFTFPLNVCGMIGTKRRFSYEGLILLTGNLVEPGYQGHLLFTVYNASNKPAFLQFEQTLCSIVFTELEHSAEKHFHDPSLIEGKFPADFVRQIGQVDPSGYASLRTEIEKITGLNERLARLEADYNDVRQPIKELTRLIEGVTRDLQEVRVISRENTENIKSLANSSQKIKDVADSHHTQLVSHGVELSWVKWGIMAILGTIIALLIVRNLDKIVPLLK